MQLCAWCACKSLHDLGEGKWRNGLSYFGLSSPSPDPMMRRCHHIISACRSSVTPSPHPLLCIPVSTASCWLMLLQGERRRVQRCHCEIPPNAEHSLSCSAASDGSITVSDREAFPPGVAISVQLWNSLMCWNHDHMYSFCILFTKKIALKGK